MVFCKVLGLSGRAMFLASKNLFRSATVEKKRFLSITHALMKERLFTDTHDWVLVDGEVATVGISNYGQESIGDIVYAQLPSLGQRYKRNDECGVLECGGSAIDIFTPISGSVVEINKALDDNPSLINTSCYEDGWLFKIKFTKREELRSLMDEKTYENFLQTFKN